MIIPVKLTLEETQAIEKGSVIFRSSSVKSNYYRFYGEKYELIIARPDHSDRVLADILVEAALLECDVFIDGKMATDIWMLEVSRRVNEELFQWNLNFTKRDINELKDEILEKFGFDIKNKTYELFRVY